MDIYWPQSRQSHLMAASSKHIDVSLMLMGFHRAISVLLPCLLHAHTLTSNYRRCVHDLHLHYQNRVYDLHLHYQNHSNYIYIFIVCLVSKRFTGYSLIETSFWPVLIIRVEENSTVHLGRLLFST